MNPDPTGSGPASDCSDQGPGPSIYLSIGQGIGCPKLVGPELRKDLGQDQGQYHVEFKAG